jgi:hypothetical protein
MRYESNRGYVAPFLAAALVTLAGSTTAVRADDDDQKVRDKKPAVIAPIYRDLPDAWKLRTREPASLGSRGR